MADLISSVPFYETPAVGDLETREILDQLIDVADEESNMLSILEYLGNMKGTANKQFFSYTNTFLYDTVAVSGTPTVTTSGVTVNVAAADGLKLRLGSVCMTANGVLLFVTAISTDAITMKTLSGSEALTNGQVLTVPTNATGEGSSNGNSSPKTIVKRSNQTQIFENGLEVSDLLMAGRTEVKFENGEQHYFYKLQDDAFKTHRIDIANNHLVGQFGDSTDANGNVVYFSRGLDNSIIDLGGVSQTTAAVGALTKADFATFSRTLDKARSPKDGMLLTGGDFNVLIDDLFDTELAAGAIDYGSYGVGSNAAKAVDLGINNFKVYGRNFEKSVLKQLDHVNVTAATGFQYPDLAYFIPKGQVKGESGAMVDRICGRYLEFASDEYINGRFHEKFLGGLAPTPTSRENLLEIRYTSHEAIELNGTEHFGRLKIQR